MQVSQWKSMIVLVMILVVYGADFSKRELKILEANLQKIQQRQIGSVLVAMIQYGSNAYHKQQGSMKEMVELIESTIDDLEADLGSLKQRHSLKLQSYSKQFQGLKQKQLDVEEMIGENDEKMTGPVEQEKVFYNTQYNRLQQLISENAMKFEQKEQSVAKMKQQLNDKVNDFDKGIEQIDDILRLIEEVNGEQQRVGIEFMQKKGNINKNLEELKRSNLKIGRNDLLMISSILQMGIKNNFDEAASKKQIIDMLLELRNKLVNELNAVGGEERQRMYQISEELVILQGEDERMRRQIGEYGEKMNENGEVNKQLLMNRRQLENSLKRLQDESQLVKEQQVQDKLLYEQREKDLRQEMEDLENTLKLIQKKEMIQFIQQQQY